MTLVDDLNTAILISCAIRRLISALLFLKLRILCTSGKEILKRFIQVFQRRCDLPRQEPLPHVGGTAGP